MPSSEYQQQLAASQDLFVWESPSWEGVQRGAQWYLWMGLVAFAMVAYAVYSANYLFAFIILLFAIIIALNGNESPKEVLVQIGHNGVVYDGTLYSFSDLSDFAIIYQPPETKVLYIQPSNVLRPRLRISLEDQNPVEIRNHLKRYVDEDLDLRDEHLSDIVGRLLKL